MKTNYFLCIFSVLFLGAFCTSVTAMEKSSSGEVIDDWLSTLVLDSDVSDDESDTTDITNTDDTDDNSFFITEPQSAEEKELINLHESLTNISALFNPERNFYARILPDIVLSLKNICKKIDKKVIKNCIKSMEGYLYKTDGASLNKDIAALIEHIEKEYFI